MSYYPNNHNYGPFEYDYDQPPHYGSPHNQRQQQPYYYPTPPTKQRSQHPLYSTSAEQAVEQAVDAQVVIDDPLHDDDEWIPDRERVKQGEVIHFDPEQPKSRPLKNAAANSSSSSSSNNNNDHDTVNDHHYEHHFRKNPTSSGGAGGGRTDGRYNEPRQQRPMDDNMPNNRVIDEPMMPPGMDMDFEGRDLSQLHSQTRHMNEEYYHERNTVRRPPQDVRRQSFSPPPYGGGGEDNMMMGMNHPGRRDTQDFSGTRTPNGREGFVTLPDVNDPMNPLHGVFEMNNGPMMGGNPFGGQYREEGYLGDSTLKEISMDFSVPIPYLADVVASWGVPVPIDPLGRLGDMVTGEQAFAILEAIHTLDIAALHDRYSEDNLMNICDYYDIDMKEAFDFAMKRGWALPFGVRTFLRVEQEDELLEALSGDAMY